MKHFEYDSGFSKKNGVELFKGSELGVVAIEIGGFYIGCRSVQVQGCIWEPFAAKE